MDFFPQSRSRSLSLQSFESSALSSGELLGSGYRRKSTPGNSTVAVLMGPTKSKKPFKNHQRFYLPTENIFFLVESTMYSVPRGPFHSLSSDFSEKGLAHEDPLVLEDVTRDHFDHFLDILYPESYGVYSATAVDEWTAILHLATIWGFTSIRALATRRLTPITTDVDKIVLGRQYGIDKWLAHAYHAVCMRAESVNKGEGRRMGVDDVVEINWIRQHFGLGTRPQRVLSLPMREVQARFGLLEPSVSLIGTKCGAAVPAADVDTAEPSSGDPPAFEPTLLLEAAVTVPVRPSSHQALPTDSCSPPIHESATTALSRWLAEPEAGISGSSVVRCSLFDDTVASIAGPKLSVLATDRATFSSSHHGDQLAPVPPSTESHTEELYPNGETKLSKGMRRRHRELREAKERAEREAEAWKPARSSSRKQYGREADKRKEREQKTIETRVWD